MFIILLFTQFDQSNYNHIVKKFVEVDIHQIMDKINNNDNFILLIGKESCPSCVKFVTLLDQTDLDEGNEIYYLELEDNTSIENNQAFLEKYNINFVPQIMVFHNGKYFMPKTPGNKSEVKELFEYFEAMKGT